MPIDLEFLEEKRWFAQKGLGSRISIIERVELGEFQLIIVSAASDSINEKYAIPLHINTGKECDSDPQYLNTLIEKMNSSTETTFSRYREIPLVNEAVIHFSGTSNVLCKADGMISKSYRRLRKNNYESEVIRWLKNRNFRSVPDCYGEGRYKDTCFHAFYEFVEGVDAGMKYYKDLLDFVEGRAIGVDARELGRTIRNLHRNLVDFIDPPEFSVWYRNIKNRMHRQLEFLSGILEKSDIRYVERAVESFLEMTDNVKKLQMTHGDLHLGQILYSKKGYIFIDFEGEPDHDSPPFFPPERDVASVIRSLDYLISALPRIDHDRGVRWSKRIADGIMDGYGVVREKIYPWLIERAIYEICYEAKNRREMMKIPLRGLKELL